MIIRNACKYGKLLTYILVDAKPQLLIMTPEDREGGVWPKIAKLAVRPPGDDKYAGEFYEAVLELKEQDPGFEQLVSGALKARKITDDHLANLMLRAAQARLMEKRDYPEAFNKARWKEEIKSILESEGKEFERDLLERGTGTTIYQRYAGPKIITGAIGFDHPVRALDVGCGRNYGLPGLELGEPFELISVGQNDGFIRGWLNRKLEFGCGWAIDKVDYRTEEAKKWGLACSFYPGELREKLPKVAALENRLEAAGKVAFIQKDFNDLLGNGIDAGRLDVIIASTVLYQDPSSQRGMIDVAKKLLDVGGILIVQDFARTAEKDGEDSSNLHFDTGWGKGEYGYRTHVSGKFNNWKWWEVLQWSNGRCDAVRPGVDFERFRDILD